MHGDFEKEAIAVADGGVRGFPDTDFDGFVALCAHESLEQVVTPGDGRSGNDTVGGVGHGSLFTDFVEDEAPESRAEVV